MGFKKSQSQDSVRQSRGAIMALVKGLCIIVQLTAVNGISATALRKICCCCSKRSNLESAGIFRFTTSSPLFNAHQGAGVRDARLGNAR
jgi:hypothetical protein